MTGPVNRIYLSLLLILAIPCIIVGQEFTISHFTPEAVGYGSRALAMGNACIALANDANSIACNPAGLAHIYDSQAALYGRFTFGSLNPHLTASQARDATLETNTKSYLLPEFIGIIFPLSTSERNVVGGIAVRHNYNLNSSHQFKYVKGDPSAPDVLREIEDNSEGGIYSLSASVGTTIITNVNVGLNFNFFAGQQKISYTEKLTENQIEEIIASTSSEYKFSGFAIDLGVQARLHERVNMGFVVSTPYTLKLVSPTIESESGEQTKYDDIGLKLPLFLSVGTGIKITDKLTCALDFRWYAWSRVTIDSTTDDNEIDLADVNSFHLGFEYIFNLDNKSVMPVRLGIHSAPRPAYQFNPDNADFRGDRINGTALCVGLGIHFNTVMLDISAQYCISNYNGKNLFSDSLSTWEINERRTAVVIGTIVKL